MLVLISGATTTPRGNGVGHLIVPTQWSLADKPRLVPDQWAIDNFAYKHFQVGPFVRTLEYFHDAPGCLFASAPDVVGDAAATRVLWPFWSKVIRGLGIRPAFVLQDGIRADQVPWDEGIAVFVGGSTEFKESATARSLMGIAKSRGVWVHVGRVNGRKRFQLMLAQGADSVDGSGFSAAPAVKIPKSERWRADYDRQPSFPA